MTENKTDLLNSTLSIWHCAWNPPNGSWGIVKVQPRERLRLPESPQRQLGDR